MGSAKCRNGENQLQEVRHIYAEPLKSGWFHVRFHVQLTNYWSIYQFVVKPRLRGPAHSGGDIRRDRGAAEAGPRRRGAFRGAAIRLSVGKCFASFRRSLVDLLSGRPGRADRVAQTGSRRRDVKWGGPPPAEFV